MDMNGFLVEFKCACRFTSVTEVDDKGLAHSGVIEVAQGDVAVMLEMRQPVEAADEESVLVFLRSGDLVVVGIRYLRVVPVVREGLERYLQDVKSGKVGASLGASRVEG